MPSLHFPRLIALVLVTLILWGAQVDAQTQPNPPEDAARATGVEAAALQLSGNEGELFLVLGQSIADPAKAGERIQSSFVFRRGTGELTFKPVGLIAGSTADLAIWRNQLVVLQPDGTWRTVFVGGSTAGILPAGGTTLRRLAGEGSLLFGLGEGESGLRLYRLQASGWEDLGAVPSPTNMTSTPTYRVELAVVNNVAHVAFLTDDGTLVLTRSTPLPVNADSEGSTRAATAPSTAGTAATLLVWTNKEPFTPLQKPVTLRFLTVGNQLVLWADPGVTTGGDAYLIDDATSGVPKNFPLGPDNGEAAASGGRVRLFYDPTDDAATDSKSLLNREPKIMERVFDLSGQQLGEPAAVALPLGPSNEDRLSTAMAALVFGGLFLAVLLSWRRRAETPIPVLEAAFRLPIASRSKRFIAGMIDCSPFFLVSAYLVSESTSSVASEVVLTPKIVFLELVAVAIVITHSMISEVIFGKTLGKHIFGLKVTDIAGNTPQPGRVVMRNLFKAVDLLLLLPLISILISPLRQSIGDSASATLVLDTTPPPDLPPPTDSE